MSIESFTPRSYDKPVIGLVLFIVVALAVFPFVSDNSYVINLLFLTIMFVTLASSWNILSGYTGYISFGHVAFFGIGAYATAILFADYGVNIYAAILIGGILALVISLPVATATLRLSDVYFAILMLAFAEVLLETSRYFSDLTGGEMGKVLPLGDYVTTTYLMMLGIMVLTLATAYFIDRSHIGLALTAIHDDEEAAGSVGLNTTRYKIIAFSLSAVYPGIVGGIAAVYWAFIYPESAFDVIISGDMMIMSVLGGMGTVLGPVLGAVVVTPLTAETQAQWPHFHGIVFGALFMVLVLWMPDGIIRKFNESSIGKQIIAEVKAKISEVTESGTPQTTERGKSDD